MITITLEGKEYQLDIEQAKKLDVLKEKVDRVRSWEEFELKYTTRTGYYWSCLHNGLVENVVPTCTNKQLTPHESQAITAFSKLLKLRRDWIKEWEPDWNSLDERKYVIEMRRNSQIEVLVCFTNSHSLSFPSYEMAQEFLKTFRDLIEEAKILI